MFTTPATEILTSYAMREVRNMKTYKKRKTSHCKGINKLSNMGKKAHAWKKFQNKMKDKRSSKKKCTLLHLLSVFLLVA